MRIRKVGIILYMKCFKSKGKEMKIFNLYITTEKEIKELIDRAWNEGEKFNRGFTRMFIRPVISSLIELRENTWDVERVDRMIDWLNDMIKDDESDDK
jgi:hypothetical protein